MWLMFDAVLGDVEYWRKAFNDVGVDVVAKFAGEGEEATRG